jgi:hypothetical protein
MIAHWPPFDGARAVHQIERRFLGTEAESVWMQGE